MTGWDFKWKSMVICDKYICWNWLKLTPLAFLVELMSLARVIFLLLCVPFCPNWIWLLPTYVLNLPLIAIPAFSLKLGFPETAALWICSRGFAKEVPGRSTRLSFLRCCVLGRHWDFLTCAIAAPSQLPLFCFSLVSPAVKGAIAVGSGHIPCTQPSPGALSYAE